MLPEGKSGSEIETGGRIASLLRQLAHCPSAVEQLPVVEALKEISGVDFENNLGKWLGWYLEEFLGIRNVISLLFGRVPEIAEEDRGVGLLGEEVVFERAEYNWCALERIKNKDDMLKLRMLYSDLESPIRTDEEGPFSFRRLSGADDEDLGYFAGKSVSQALFDGQVQVRHLRILKDYGKMMMMPLFPSATQRAGTILYAASISQALVLFDSKVTSLSYKDLMESLPGLLERPYIVDSYARLFREAMEKCR